MRSDVKIDVEVLTRARWVIMCMKTTRTQRKVIDVIPNTSGILGKGGAVLGPFCIGEGEEHEDDDDSRDSTLGGLFGGAVIPADEDAIGGSESDVDGSVYFSQRLSRRLPIRNGAESTEGRRGHI